MAINPYTVKPVEGLRDSGRRGISFLQSNDEYTDIDAADVFDGLKENRSREVRSRFDHWIDGNTNKRWFHGWPGHPTYGACFTFKWKDRNQHHRFYGFLCHPTPRTAPALQVCVLVYHETKNQDETDEAVLARVVNLSQLGAVKAAIQEVYPDSRTKKSDG